MKVSKSSLKLVLRDPGFSDQLTDMIIKRLDPQDPLPKEASAAAGAIVDDAIERENETQAGDKLHGGPPITDNKQKLLKVIRAHARTQRDAKWRRVRQMDDRAIVQLLGDSWTAKGAIKKVTQFLDLQ
jgi:hypothetical protein